MALDAGRHEVIDSDGHVVEPDTVWSDYAETEFRGQLDVPGGGVQALGDRCRTAGRVDEDDLLAEQPRHP